MTNKRIDIIIPAYQARDVLGRCLASIAMQVDAGQIQVTVINDGCPTGSYKDIIDRYTPMVDIQEIILPQNSGPGVARQHGIDNTNCPYIMFVDSDDTLANAFAIRSMLRCFTMQKACALFGDFYVETEDGSINDYNKRNMGLHGKIYNRAFLRDYHICFNDKRLYEDSFFQSQVEFYIQRLGLPCIDFEDKVCVYHYTPTSLCRSIDDDVYSLTMITAWTTNMIELIQKFEKEKFVEVEDFKNACAVELYIDYNYTCARNNKHIAQVEDVIQQYMDIIFKDAKVNLQECEELYSILLKEDAMTLVGGDDIKMLVPPVITFTDFIAKFQTGENNE